MGSARLVGRVPACMALVLPLAFGVASPATATVTRSKKPVHYVIVYASMKSKSAAVAKRKLYQGWYGDAAPLLTVDRSSHYRGLKKGHWVVISGYRTKSAAKNDLSWARQHRIPGSIKAVKKLCSDKLDVL